MFRFNGFTVDEDTHRLMRPGSPDIMLERQQATLEDLGSKNGTYVGEERVTSPRPLADGDQIRLGPVVITFRIPPPVGSTETFRRSLL